MCHPPPAGGVREHPTCVSCRMDDVKAAHGCTPTLPDRRWIKNPGRTSFRLAPLPSSSASIIALPPPKPPHGADDGVCRSAAVASFFFLLSFPLFRLQSAEQIQQSLMVLSAGATSESRGGVCSLRDSNVLPHKTNTIMLGMFVFFFRRRRVADDIGAV